MSDMDWGVLIPALAMCIPIVAIVGGVVHSIVRTLGQQKMVELAQRERIAALERGVDPAKLPPLPTFDWGDSRDPGRSAHERERHRVHGLLIGGLVTLAVGISMSIFLGSIEPEKPTWLVGMVPGSVGVALLLSALLLRPRGDDLRPPGTR